MRARAWVLTGAAVIVAAGWLGATAILASDESGFKALKASFEKLAKVHDDAANRERRKLLRDAADFIDQKPCRKLLRDAYAEELAADNRVQTVLTLARSGDPKDIEFLLNGFKKEKAAGPVVALGQGLGFTASETVADVSKFACGQLAKSKGDVLRSLIEGIGELGDPGGYQPVLALGDKLTGMEGFERLVALGACGRAQSVPVLEKASKLPSADLRAGATRGLMKSLAAEASPVLAGLLGDADPRVVEMAATTLGDAKFAAAKDKLIEVLPAQPMRVKEAIRNALKSITGKDCGWDAAAWKSGTPGALPAPFPQFCGMQIPSDRVVLLMDLSKTMDWNGRLAKAREVLKAYLAALPDDAMWDVIGVSRTPVPYANRLNVGKDMKASGEDFIQKQLTGGGFDLREAMQYVFRTLPETDTVVVATDHYPWGDANEDTPLTILQEIRKENRIHRVRVFIAFIAPGGRYTTSETDAAEYEDRKDVLREFAESTDGRFVAVE